MRRILLTTLALVAVVAVAAPAAGARDHHETIVVKVASPPEFRYDPQCPEFLGVAALTHPDGSAVGTGYLCVRQLEFPPNAFVEHARLTVELQGGTIEIEVTLVDVFRPNGSAHHSGSGVVVGGTGRYVGATGTFAGVGRIVFGADGIPSPDLTYVVRLSF